MTRSVFAAVLCLLAGSHAKNYSPKSSAELEAAFLVVKPSDSIKLESGTYVARAPSRPDRPGAVRAQALVALG